MAAGIGGTMPGPGLVTLGQGIMAVGTILTCTGMLSVPYVEKEQAEKWISAGLLTLVAGAAIALIGYAVTMAGIVGVVAVSSVATKATVKAILRKRLETKRRHPNWP